MSAPPAPNCIRKAVRRFVFTSHDADDAAQAVWDALLDEARGVIYLPDFAKLGHTTSFTAFGIDPRPFVHPDYQPHLAVPLPGAPQHNTHA